MNSSRAKRVLIPIEIVGGELINLITGDTVEGIIDGTYCVLAVPDLQINDWDLLNLLNERYAIDLLPAGAELRIPVNCKEIPAILKGNIEISENQRIGTVKAVLREPLELEFRGTKQPFLNDCPCYIPLLNESAKSVNHAYTIISTAFEPERRSHTANVFLTVCYFDRNLHDWKPLEVLRERRMAEYFESLKQRYREMKSKRS